MSNTPSFQEYLEAYLKNEGVFVLIPKNRQIASISSILVLIWMFSILVISSVIGYEVAEFGGILSVLGLATAGFLIISLGLIIYYTWRLVARKQNVGSSDASFLGSVYLFVYPIILSIAIAVYTKSLFIGLLAILLYALTFLIVMIVNTKSYGIYVALRSILVTFVDLARSIRFAFVLFPLLLIVIFLSVFSSELWQAIGGVTVIRLSIAVILLALPTILLAISSFKPFVKEMIVLPQDDHIFNVVTEVPYLKEKLLRGFISNEELLEAKQQLAWRDKSRLLEEMNIVERAAFRSLLFLLFSTSFILMLIFLIYFYVLFKVLIGDELVSIWTQIPLRRELFTINFWGNSFDIGYNSSDISFIKTSALLSVFIAITTIVQSFTDETVKKIFFSHLQQKVNTWLSVGAVYHSLVHRNFQLWSIDEAKNKPGIVEVSVVIPRGLQESQIKTICEYVEGMFQHYKHFVRVIAFEQNPTNPIYKRGFPALKWVLFHNKKVGIRNFSENHIIVDNDEPEYDHLLGDRLLANSSNIPDDWFGNTPLAVQVARMIWEVDANHSLVLHPTGFNTNKDTLLLDIRLRKRMLTSEWYVEYVKGVIEAVLLLGLGLKAIMVVVYLREGLDRLASGDWFDGLNFMSYSDEFMEKTRYIPIDVPSVGAT